MLALPELPQLRVLSRLACVRFFIKYEIIFYMKTRPLSPPSSPALLPTPHHLPLTCANAHFSARRGRLFVVLFMGCSSPALFVSFRGWFDALRSTPWPFPPPLSSPFMRLALIINCIIGFACCLCALDSWSGNAQPVLPLGA